MSGLKYVTSIPNLWHATDVSGEFSVQSLCSRLSEGDKVWVSFLKHGLCNVCKNHVSSRGFKEVKPLNKTLGSISGHITTYW